MRADQVLHRRLAVRCAEQRVLRRRRVRRPARAAPWTARSRTGRRRAAGRRGSTMSSRVEVVTVSAWQRELVVATRMSVVQTPDAVAALGRREPHLRAPRRHRRVRHARRRRQGQGAAGGRARTSSGSAPASPTSPRRTTSSRPRSPRARTRRTTTTRPPAGLPELQEAIAAKTLRDSGFECDGVAGARHQRRQARRVHRVRRAVRSGRRGDLPGAVLDHVSRGDHPRRRRAGRHRHRRRRPASRSRSSSSTRRVHRPHEGAAVRQPRQPVGFGLHARRGRGDRPVGASTRACG